MSKPLLAVTMGDPAGVGPEVCLQLLDNSAVHNLATPLIFGDGDVLTACARATELPPPRTILSLDEWIGNERALTEPSVLDLPVLEKADFSPGVISAATGAAGYHYVDRAIVAARAGQVDGIVTAPLNKEALHLGGVPYPGHTEMFADRTNAERACMLQYSEEVRASFVTVHVGYDEVPALLSVDRILDVIELTAEAMRRIRTPNPHLAVLGLNPHAGENGLFGNGEEERIIIPAIEAARRRGLDVIGPLPPDTAFLPERRRSTDALICMYHDQGHIPLKAIAFDSAVNTTLGLPIIRTSVDHGTALDIAWQGKAKGSSLVEAFKLAAQLAAA